MSALRLTSWLLAAALAIWPLQPLAQKPGEARLAGMVTEAAVDEISGIAASRRHPGILWVHNDSGNPPELYALDEQAELRATYRVRDVPNFDWEDLAGFTRGGEHWLLLGDFGDNGGVRKELYLHLFREPERIADGELVPERTLRFVWPDGARDCESVAVAPAENAIYLISKKRVPPELFRLPLDGDSTHAPLVAERVGLIRHVSQPTPSDLHRNPRFGRYRAQITGMDISSDGRQMAVINYLQARIYVRRVGETWAQAVARRPIDVPYPWLAQAEAIGFSVDGRSLWIGTEKLPAPLLRIPLH